VANPAVLMMAMREGEKLICTPIPDGGLDEARCGVGRYRARISLRPWRRRLDSGSPASSFWRPSYPHHATLSSSKMVTFDQLSRRSGHCPGALEDWNFSKADASDDTYPTTGVILRDFSLEGSCADCPRPEFPAYTLHARCFARSA